MSRRRLALALPLLLAAPGLFASDFALPVVRDSLTQLQRLRDQGGVSFRNAEDQRAYDRVLQMLSRLSQDMGGGGGGGAVENVRRQARAFLTATLSPGDVRKVVNALPEVVTEDDFAFLQEASREVSGPWMGLVVGAYFTHPSEAVYGNSRGRAAGAMAASMGDNELYDALKALPAYLSGDDGRFLAWLASTSSGPWMKLLVQGYAATASQRDRRNQRGTAGRILCEGLGDSERYDLVKALPAYIADADLPLLQTIAEKDSGAMRVFRAKQYFQSR